MAELRLIAVLCVAACTSADAQPPNQASGIAPPQGWLAQPEIAEAAKTALGKTTVDGIEAFGEPAMGCYSLWLALRGSGSATALAEQLLRGLQAEPEGKRAAPRKLEIADVVKPTTDEGVLSLTFASPPYAGRLRARLGQGKITALACFASQREPAACEAACTALFARGGMP